MKSLFLFFGCLSCVVVFSCGKKNTPESTPVQEEKIELPKKNVEYPKLSPNAQDMITSWQYFQEFENDLKRINQGNVRSYQRETERMVSVADSLLKNIPEPLNTNAISSRMRVVNTRVKLLDEKLNQPNSDADDILTNLDETNKAFSNLLIQINEKFEKERIDSLTKTDDKLEKDKISQKNDSI